MNVISIMPKMIKKSLGTNIPFDLVVKIRVDELRTEKFKDLVSHQMFKSFSDILTNKETFHNHWCRF